MVHTGIYQDETFPVKYILVHESTSPVDLVYILLGRAGSLESCRIAAAEGHTNSSRNHLLFVRWGGAAAAGRGRLSSRARSSCAGAASRPPPPPPPASPQPPSRGRGSRWRRCRPRLGSDKFASEKSCLNDLELEDALAVESCGQG